MVNFLKNFGKGILYILVLPFLVVALAIYAVVGIFVFIFLAIKGLFLFFTGRSLYDDLPEDKEAKKRLGITHEEEKREDPQQGATYQESTFEEEPIGADPFYVPEYLKETKSDSESEAEEEVIEHEDDIPSFMEEPPVEETAETPIEHEPESIEKPVLEEPQESIVEPEEDVISSEKTMQNTAILDISEVEDDDDDSNGNGIDIDFN